jgi:hypothetical protein
VRKETLDALAVDLQQPGSIAGFAVSPVVFAGTPSATSPAAPSPISARPEAIETSSPPLSSLASPNRSANRRRTAGTKDEPPVRNTRSIPLGPSRPRQRLVDGRLDGASSGAIQASNSLAADRLSRCDVAGLEAKVRLGSADSVSFSRETAW